jgi:hypothetical protein
MSPQPPGSRARSAWRAIYPSLDLVQRPHLQKQQNRQGQAKKTRPILMPQMAPIATAINNNKPNHNSAGTQNLFVARVLMITWLVPR